MRRGTEKLPGESKLAGIAELPDQRLRLPLGLARVKQAEQGKGLVRPDEVRLPQDRQKEFLIFK